MNQSLTGIALAGGLLVALAGNSVRAENLESAWEAALTRDHILEASRDEVAAASEELAAARARRLPALSASAGITRFNETPSFDFSGAGVPATLPLFGNENMERADARLTVPLYTGGATGRGVAAAESMLAAREANSEAGVQQVKLDVARHYINVLRARRALAVADKTVASLRAHVADVDNMFESGAVARNDYLSAAVSLADAEQRQLQTRIALDLANAAYNRALGRDLGATVTLDENLPGVDSQIDHASLQSLTAIALANRHELSQYGAAADALRSRSDARRAQTKPQLALTGGYTSLKNEFLNRDDFWMVGVGVQWNLFDGGQSRRKANALAYRARAVERERANLESFIALEVRQAWLRLQETRERIRLAERAVEQAEENLRVVRDRYRNGEGTNTEVLDAETLRALSRSNYDNADFDARLALYELARGAGRL